MRRSLVTAVVLSALVSAAGWADEATRTGQAKSGEVASNSELTSLNKSGTVQIDLKGKRLLVKADVVMREGLLEMLACLKQTKEHESLLSVDAKAQVIHAGLVALGAEAGSPATFVPDYKPATGQQIDIFFTWTDAEGKLHRDAAQKWVRHATRRYFVEKLDPPPKDLSIPVDSDLKWDEKRKELLWYGPMTESQRDTQLKINKDLSFQKAIKSMFAQSQTRQMDANWVFAGSGFSVDANTGEKFYLAEAGDLICVANFATATLDLAIESSATNDTLLFEAYTERIPPIGTKVTIELVPVFKKPANPKSPPSSK